MGYNLADEPRAGDARLRTPEGIDHGFRIAWTAALEALARHDDEAAEQALATVLQSFDHAIEEWRLVREELRALRPPIPGLHET